MLRVNLLRHRFHCTEPPSFPLHRPSGFTHAGSTCQTLIAQRQISTKKLYPSIKRYDLPFQIYARNGNSISCYVDNFVELFEEKINTLHSFTSSCERTMHATLAGKITPGNLNVLDMRLWKSVPSLLELCSNVFSGHNFTASELGQVERLELFLLVNEPFYA